MPKEQVETLNGGENAFLDVNDITQDPKGLQYRTLDKETVETLTKDISQRGLLQPLIVWNGSETVEGAVDEENKPVAVLVAGNHRFHAIRAIKKADPAAYKRLFPNGVLVRVVSGTEADLLLVQLAENTSRKDMAVADILPIMVRLVDDHGMKNGQIAKQIGKSPAWVSQILSSREELGEEGVEEVVKGKIGIRDMIKAKDVVKKAKAAGKPISAKEALAKVKAKSGKAAGKGKSERRLSASTIYKRYTALPNMKMGAKLVLLEAILAYLAGESDTVPEEVAAEVSTDGGEE